MPITYKEKFQIEKMINVLQAYNEGKKLRYRNRRFNDTWSPVIGMPSWNFERNEYQVIPQPREWRVDLMDGNIANPCDSYHGRMLERGVLVREVLE